jgi:hypothetical protein
MFRRAIPFLLLAACGFLTLPNAVALDEWVRYPGGEGPGKGKKIVLISGDEEYRSEEGLPQLGKILAKRHGFDCTVLFAVNPKTGTIDPNVNDNIPGLDALADADLVIMLLRFRNLPDDQMEKLAAYIESGKPIIALRTSTHAFNIPADRKYADYSFNSKNWNGGFGRQVLGETWISHHGVHGKQATRGILAPGKESHPILKGIASGEIFGPSDVYGVLNPLPGDSQPLVLGEVVSGMNPADPPQPGKQNEPMMPVAWTKTYKTRTGAVAKVFTTTMGASQDLSNEALRRLIVNASYWATGLENQIPEKADVAFVGTYEPTRFAFNGFTKGKKPSDFALTP